MRINRVAIFLFLLVWLVPMLAFSDIYVDLKILNQYARVFYVGDLDFTKTGKAPEIFRLTIWNRDNFPQRIYLTVQIIYNGDEIARGRTNQFNVPANLRFDITQNALTRGMYVIPGTTERIQLKDYSLDVNKIEGLRDKILATGRLPSGKYQFIIKAHSLTSHQVYEELPEQLNDNVLLISNPTNVQLIFPGSPVGDANVPVVNTLYPYLQWQSDANIFNIYVYKKLPTDRNAQDVLSHPPVLFVKNYTVPSNQRQYLFQYPTNTSPLRFSVPEEFQSVISFSGSVGPIRMLEAGSTYYWYVEALIPTGGGSFQPLKSEVFQFQVQSQAPVSASNQQIFILLRSLGGEKLIRQLQRLQEQGYTPTGRIRWNGREIDLTELMRHINEIRTKNYRVRNVVIY